VTLQILGQLLHRACLFETDLRVARDVVTEREQLRVHELFGARHYAIALWIGCRQTRDKRRDVERSLQVIHLAQDIVRGFAFRRRLLRAKPRQADDSDTQHDR
jgi:hypothetical protein